MGKSNFLSIRRVIFSYFQPVKFVRLYSGHAQSDGKSSNRGLPELDLQEVAILGVDQKDQAERVFPEIVHGEQPR